MKKNKIYCKVNVIVDSKHTDILCYHRELFTAMCLMLNKGKLKKKNKVLNSMFILILDLN